MSKREPPRRIRGVPSKAMAAGFLRVIAQKVGQSVADPVTRARDLQLIADCIEGRTRWRKGSRFTWEQERRIAVAVHLVEIRPAGMSVITSAQGQAVLIATEWGAPRDRALMKRIVNRILTVRRL